MNYQNTMTKEFNELRDFILSKGYTCWDTDYQEFGDAKMITQNLQRRVDKVYNMLPVCNCNDKLYINVDIIQTVQHDQNFMSLEEKVIAYMKYQCDDHILRRIEKTSEILHCSRRQLQRVLHELVEKDILIKLSKGVYCFKK